MIIHRRGLLAAGTALGVAGFGPRARAAEADLFPIVETAEGRLRGLTSGGIKVFRGVRYAESTAGANRFRPPQPLKPWAGVRDTLDFGNISPQVPADRRRDYADLIFNDMQPGGMGEDCLVLNLWTPSLDRAAKKPVLVRFHGGGFYGGSSNSPGGDGEMLARFGDCVVITVNHRLSAFGYLHLGDGGNFADSGSAGMQDLVACLAWVGRNVEAFGGDPKRVMIFGQSGGGAKVSHLLAMPSAKGLFSSAAVMSGSRLTAMSRADAQATSEQLLGKLGLKATQIRELQALPWTTILAAQAELEAGQRARGEAPRSFAPVLGSAIPHHPFAPAAPAESAHIPLIVSTVLDERTYREANFGMTWEEVRKNLTARAGARADEILAAYRDEDPKATPYVINARIVTDATFRQSARIMADRKAQQGAAPLWAYLWTAPSPAFGGRYGATHGVDVSYAMHDIRMPLAGPIADNRRLADEIASAFVALAAKGDPNNPKTPAWPAYDAAKRTTMVFGTPSSGAVEDPRRRLVELWVEGVGRGAAE
ncbi:carboxylesterase/lipase family protein [Phenylobacterium terrae]|uniref:Carboxylic ester hydrolase n=1 Tax=Phenylobacterium terrae TaxID=2665495 RepID=A0ABW4N7H7_9CAUL